MHGDAQCLTVSDKFSVRATLPEVPVSVIVAVVGGRTVVPGPPQPQKCRKLKSSTVRPAMSTCRRRPSATTSPASINVIPNPSKSADTNRKVGHHGVLGGSIGGRVITLEVLLTVTVNADEDDPLDGTKAGDTAQIDGGGAPLQVSATLPLNPLAGDTCKLYVTVWPAVMTATVEQFPPAGQLEPLASANEKSVPVPASETL